MAITLDSLKPFKQSIKSSTYLPNELGHDIQLSLRSTKGTCLGDASSELTVRCRITSEATSNTRILDSSCTKDMAIQKARIVGDQLALLSGFKADASVEVRKVIDEKDDFEVLLVYDTGISVPAYKVRLNKNSCLIKEITYLNFEG